MEILDELTNVRDQVNSIQHELAEIRDLISQLRYQDNHIMSKVNLWMETLNHAEK